MPNPKLCIDCRHYTRFYGFCKAPENDIDPVSGEVKKVLASYSRISTFSSRCGPEAKYFSPRTSLMGLLLKFWRRNHA